MELIETLKDNQTKSFLTIPSTFVSHKRSQRKIYPRYVLLRIDNVSNREAASKYIGNCVEYIRDHKNGKKKNMGVITRVHGNSGIVMARFKTNLPPQDVGKTASIKLYKVGIDEI